jgi:hypothetical protein
MNFLDTEQQGKACRSLLASVVNLALLDACIEPHRDRKKPINYDAWTAMRFLFDEDEYGLEQYALWLDFDPEQFRERVMKIMKDDSALRIGGFDTQQRRAFRYNFRRWSETKQLSEQEVKND